MLNQFNLSVSSALWYKFTWKSRVTNFSLENDNKHVFFLHSDCSVGWPIAAAKDDVLAEKLWKLSENLVQLSK